MPLGFMSRALTPTEIKWTVWEKELKASQILIHTFLSIVGDFWCILHTDHLNNLTMSAGLRFPEKVLRVLQDIETRVCAIWSFMPGATNFCGDGLSRNCKERDHLRDSLAAYAELPKSLGEAFGQILFHSFCCRLAAAKEP